MKKQYISPDVEIKNFKLNEVFTASGDDYELPVIPGDSGNWELPVIPGN